MFFLIQSADLCAPSEIRTRTVMILSHRPLPVGLSGQIRTRLSSCQPARTLRMIFRRPFLTTDGDGFEPTFQPVNLYNDLSNMSKNFSLVILYKRLQRILMKENHFFKSPRQDLNLHSRFCRPIPKPIRTLGHIISTPNYPLSTEAYRILVRSGYFSTTSSRIRTQIIKVS